MYSGSIRGILEASVEWRNGQEKNGNDRTVSIKSAPTESSPTPLGTTLPSAISRRATKSSANSARSEILPKMIRVSSRVIGGPSDVEDEEPEAVESVRVDEDEDED